MFRHAMKCALTGFVTAALIVGFAPATASAGAPATTVAAAAAPDCTAERDAVVAAAQVARQRIANLTRSNRAVAKARVALRKADGARQTAKAHKSLRAAKAEKRIAVSRKKRSIDVLRAAVTQLTTCQNSGGGGGGVGAAGALQPVCDLGLPQVICDALDALPLPGGAGGTSPAQPLCDAGLPQPICDAATGLPLPGGASAIQPLCDAGLPQGICDIASGAVDVDSLPIPPGLPQLPAFEFRGIPEVAGLDLLIGLLAPVTGSLPLSALCEAIDVPIVCDLVAP